MKILIATPYFHPRTGGLETYAWHLAQGLRARGLEPVVVCGDQVAAPTRDSVDGLRVYRLPVMTTVSNTPIHPGWPGMLRRILREERPDVINAHAPVVFMVDAVALVAGARPLVVTYHAATLVKPGSLAMQAATRAYHLVQRATLGRADAIVAVSDHVRRALVHRYPRWQSKIHIVSNAVVSAGPGRPATEPGDGLVFIASLQPTHSWKGLDAVLEALAEYHRRHGVRPELTVLGDGADLPRYQRRATALGLGSSVRFAGYLPPPERDALLRRARALVAYPTTANDAFPTVFLDAWAQGVPVVAAAIGALPSLVDEGVTGLLARPGDPADLARALHSVLTDPERAAAMGTAGQELVAREYTWPHQIDRMLGVLGMVTRHRHSRPGAGV